MTWTQFYSKDESKVIQEGFFQILFPHFPSAGPSYPRLAGYKLKNCKSESPPHSLLIAVFELVSVHTFLSGSEGLQKSTLNSVFKTIHHFCAAALGQVGNAGMLLCSKALSTSTEATTFKGLILPRCCMQFLWTLSLYIKQGSNKYNLQHGRMILSYDS